MVFKPDVEPKTGAGYYVVLVAICVQAGSMQNAQEQIMPFLPRPEVDMAGYPAIDSWWIAEDERYDGSDNDSAAFCGFGRQRAARAAIVEAGLGLQPDGT